MTRLVRWVARIVAASLLSGSAGVLAHPLSFHLEPLNDARIERALAVFDSLRVTLASRGAVADVRLTEDAMGPAALAWSVQDAVFSLQASGKLPDATLQETLLAAGYEDSPYALSVWRFEAERVLSAYEVINSGLEVDAVYEAMAALDGGAGDMSPDVAEARAAALVRQADLLHDTALDLPAVEPFRRRIDALVGGLGGLGGRAP